VYQQTSVKSLTAYRDLSIVRIARVSRKIIRRFGPAHALGTSPAFFMGPRFAVFNHATQALGGAVTVNRFSVTT